MGWWGVKGQRCEPAHGLQRLEKTSRTDFFERESHSCLLEVEAKEEEVKRKEKQTTTREKKREKTSRKKRGAGVGGGNQGVGFLSSQKSSDANVSPGSQEVNNDDLK